MKSRLGAWAFLRPLLLALAAAASWIALSAVGASADSSTSGDSLPGAGPATLISAPATVTHPVKDVLEPVEAGLGGNFGSAPASAIPTPVTPPPLRATVEEATGLVDQVVETVPVVGRMVPDGTVAVVVDPAVGTVDGLVGGAVDGLVGGAVGTLVPLAGGALEPLDRVLEPAIGAVPLPAAAPEGAPDGTPPAVTAVPQVSGETAAHPAETAAELEGTVPASARATSFDTLKRNGAACDAEMRPASVTAVLSAAGPEYPPVDTPQAPASPGATTGGSSPSGGNSPAMPAWPGADHFQIPPFGTAAARASLAVVPAPVSFGPGSSPD